MRTLHLPQDCIYYLGHALHDEEQDDHLSNDIVLSSNTPESSKLSPALDEVII